MPYLVSVLMMASAYGIGNYFINLKSEAMGFIDPLHGYLVILIIGFAGALASMWLDASNYVHRQRWQFVAVLGSTALITLIFLWHNIGVRMNNPVPVARNDGLVQSVDAARFLLHGTNPYGADYTTSDFRVYPSPRGDNQPNLAAHYFPYPPAVIYLFTPLVAMADSWHIAIDYQSVYTICLFVVVALLCLLAKRWSTRSLIVLFTLGNPVVLWNALSGFNDLFFVAALLAALLALDRRCWVLAGLAIGLAIGAKQTSWLLVPLWAWWLWLKYQRREINFQPITKLAWSAVISSLVIYLPFIVWNPGTLYLDIIRYVSGTIPNTLTISGATLLQYFRVFGLIADPWTTFPTWIIQAPIVLLTLIMVGRWVKRSTKTSRLMLSSAWLLLVVVLTNRFGGVNYFVPVIIFTVAAFVYGQLEEPQPRT